jgi:hypothetical protein
MSALGSVVCCQVEGSVSGSSIVQRSPTECGVSECDREASAMRRPWPTGGYRAMKKNASQNNEYLWLYVQLVGLHTV